MTLERMFDPESVAVIGASASEGKVGNGIIRSLDRDFIGKIYPVNPKVEKILGHDVYSSVKEIEGEVDLAVISIPAPKVPRVVKECGESGVKNVIIVAAGFREAGRDDLGEEIKESAETHDINVIGPNCLGVYNSKNGLDTIFNPPERMGRPDEGSVAFLSQSGAFGTSMLDWLAEENIGLSKFVSYGNRADVDEADLIRYLDSDPETDIITYYIEGLKDGRKFVKASNECDKPIIALKSGRTSAGSSAATSHTASLAGKDEIYDGAFKQSDILRVKTVRELFNVIKTLSFQSTAEGEGIGIVTNGGGVGVMAADSIGDHGLGLVEFTRETDELFKQAVDEGDIPHHASLDNPVDIVGDASAERYQAAMDIVLSDGNVDGLIVVFQFQSPVLEEGVIRKTKEMKKHGKPIVAVTPGGEYTREQIEKIEDEGIPVYQTPEEGVQAMRALTRLC